MTNPILFVRFFCSQAGNEPVRDFLKSLPPADRKTMGTDIKTVQYGWPLGMPLVRKMAPDLWEVRSDIEDGIARVFFTVLNGQMVLLHAFVKKSQKTPTNELDTAKNRLKQLRGNP